MFDPVSPWPALACLVLALLTGRALVLAFGAPPSTGRFVSIDGLRGYLALAVFLHHGSTWYFYVRTGLWLPPPSHLYTQFGHAGVALFFMITGFLFFTKLLNDRGRGTDWTKLFVSRVMRLTPLYLVSIVVLFAIVAVLSGGQLRTSGTSLAAGIGHWLGFTMFDTPDLNGVLDTRLIDAGVTWSLPYEWLFYLSLPLMACALGRLPPWPALCLAVLGVSGFVWLHPGKAYILAFAGGIVAALCVRSPRFNRFAATLPATGLTIAALVATVVIYPSAHAVGPLALLTVAFALIAGGNTLFGALAHPVSRILGEIAYGIYLLHGIFLFVLFHFVVGPEASSRLSVPGHWALVVLTTPAVLVASYAAFRLIESPAMRKATPLTNWIRSRTSRLRRPLQARTVND